jgi:hypothetical protein
MLGGSFLVGSSSEDPQENSNDAERLGKLLGSYRNGDWIIEKPALKAVKTAPKMARNRLAASLQKVMCKRLFNSRSGPVFALHEQ